MTPLHMDRLDFDLQVLELPRLAEREVEGFLKYRIAGLYPAHPEETAFDYRIWQRGKSRFAFLCITRRAVLESYRQQAEGRPLLLPFLLILPYLKEHAGEELAVAVFSPSCLETFVFRAAGPPAAVVARRSRRPTADLAAARRQSGAGAARWIVCCGPRDAEALAGQAQGPTAGEGAVRLVGIEEALDRMSAKERGLFAPARRAPLLAAGMRRQILAAALLVLGLLALIKLTAREEAYYRRLRRQAGLLQSRSAVTLALQEEVEALERRKAALLRKRPDDPYRLLAELHAALAPAARLQSFILERRFFQLEAVGSDPLALMDAFRERGYFGEVRLLQTVPRPGSDQEQFKITGSVRGE